jgi:hypothetical protein
MTTDWRNMPGPGDPETWGPCTGHPNDPRTPDDTERFEETREKIIETRMRDVGWFREALAEADDDQIKEIMDAVKTECDVGMDQMIDKIVRKYVDPNDWEIGEQIEMEDEPDDRV